MQRRINDFEAHKQNILIQIAKEIEGLWKYRIFTAGKAANDSTIGRYSTNSTYVSIEAFEKTSAFNSRVEPRKRAVNKGKSPGGAGSPRTTIDLPGGYAELRQIQGRESTFVNLDYTGSLRLSFQIGTRGEAVVYGTPNVTETNKKRWLEQHFAKDIFSLSDEEVAAGSEVCALLVSKYLFA